MRFLCMGEVLRQSCTLRADQSLKMKNRRIPEFRLRIQLAKHDRADSHSVYPPYRRKPSVQILFNTTAVSKCRPTECRCWFADLALAVLRIIMLASIRLGSPNTLGQLGHRAECGNYGTLVRLQRCRTGRRFGLQSCIFHIVAPAIWVNITIITVLTGRVKPEIQRFRVSGRKKGQNREITPWSVCASPVFSCDAGLPRKTSPAAHPQPKISPNHSSTANNVHLGHSGIVSRCSRSRLESIQSVCDARHRFPNRSCTSDRESTPRIISENSALLNLPSTCVGNLSAMALRSIHFQTGPFWRCSSGTRRQNSATRRSRNGNRASIPACIFSLSSSAS